MKMVVFDWDGTLTPQRSSALVSKRRGFLTGVLEKLQELRAAGVLLAVATNQHPDMSLELIRERIAWLQGLFRFDAVLFAQTPERRKPQPAMLLEIAERFGVSPDQTLFVGDAETDRQAAEAAGCRFCWAEEFLGR